MSLINEKFLFLDCQTTGMRPPAGKLLEVAWGIGSAQDESLQERQSHILQLPEGFIPHRIKQLTGIQDEDLEQAVPEILIFNELKSLPELKNIKTAVIHYSQFECAFFGDLFLRLHNDDKLPFQVICSAQISRRLFPNIPSGNIRAVAGYFGSSIKELKRAATHVDATFDIWKVLAFELEKKGLHSVADIEQWLKESPKLKKKEISYEYRIDKMTRLAFPDTPGIYKMLNKKGEVLYVGKATSLKSRVNSYFRGQKGRDRKKLEMLSQVWTIEYVQCETPLESALLETDEIKRLNPPYNILLKNNRRAPVFYDRNFLSVTSHQNAHHSLGPFRPESAIESLRLLCKGLLQDEVHQVFYDEIPEELLLPGFLKFCEQAQLDPKNLNWVRDCIAFGMKMLRVKLQEEENVEEIVADEDVVTEESQEDLELEEVLTIDDIADKFMRLFLRSAQEYRRARRLTKLLNAKIEWIEKEKSYSLKIQNGKVNPTEADLTKQAPWEGLDLSDYDRMSVLLSEIEKHEHKIIPLNAAKQTSLF